MDLFIIGLMSVNLVFWGYRLYLDFKLVRARTDLRIIKLIGNNQEMALHLYYLSEERDEILLEKIDIVFSILADAGLVELNRLRLVEETFTIYEEKE